MNPDSLDRLDITALCANECPEGRFEVAGFTNVENIDYMSLKAGNNPLVALFRRDGGKTHLVLFAAAKFAKDEGYGVEVEIRDRQDTIHINFHLPDEALLSWRERLDG